jgi:hypothetical protein
VSLCTPSASIINVLPFLDIIPGPMPWRKRAQTYRKREDALYDMLITDAVSGKASGMNTYVSAQGEVMCLYVLFTGGRLRSQERINLKGTSVD